MFSKPEFKFDFNVDDYELEPPEITEKEYEEERIRMSKNMKYISWYRKYRPTQFAQVVGHDAIIQTLQNEVASKRIANAYLFCGTHGSGKTTVARIFAKAINCLNPLLSEPCMKCKTCLDNIDITEIDAASHNGVDDIRILNEESNYSCQSGGKYRVYIIDEVHMLSTAAFNALLKTLEEPTDNVVFILATTERHKVPLTIASRCQTFIFSPVDQIDIMDKLEEICDKEGFTYDEDAIEDIAIFSKGSVRDAIVLLEQVCHFSNDYQLKGKHVSMIDVKQIAGEIDSVMIDEIQVCIAKKSVAELMEISAEIFRKGISYSLVAETMYEFYKNLFVSSTARKSNQMDDYNFRLMRIFAELKQTNKRAEFEIGLIHCCVEEMDEDYKFQQLQDKYNDLLLKFKELEEKCISENKIEFDDNDIPIFKSRTDEEYANERIEVLNAIGYNYNPNNVVNIL